MLEESKAFCADNAWLEQLINESIARDLAHLTKPRKSSPGCMAGRASRATSAREVFRRHLPPPYADHEYFICGPNVMMDTIERALGELDVPLAKYHSERYSFV